MLIRWRLIRDFVGRRSEVLFGVTMVSAICVAFVKEPLSLVLFDGGVNQLLVTPPWSYSQKHVSFAASDPQLKRKLSLLPVVLEVFLLHVLQSRPLKPHPIVSPLRLANEN